MIAQRDFYAHYETLSQLQTMLLVDDGQQQALGINFHMFNGKEKKLVDNVLRVPILENF
jgi:hypothetical protein